MSPLSEQFSEARTLQLETHFNFFHNVTGKAFESAEKLLALNFDISRASLEQSSNLVRQLIAVRDPRDLFALTRQSQSQFDHVLSYGRQLFGIAAGTAVAAASASVSTLAPALAAPVFEALVETALAVEPASIIKPAPAVTVVAAPVPVPVPALMVEAKRAAEIRSTEQPTPAILAVSHPEAVKPSAASFPVKSSAQPIAVASIKPAKATPPPAQAGGAPAIVTAKAAAPGPKAARKK